jgi:hypothetical protein
MTSRRDEAAALVRDSLVWDNVWPLEPGVGNDLHRTPSSAPLAST